MTPDDLDARLESVAGRVPPPDPAFSDRLEARLTAVHQLVADEPAPHPARRVWLRPLLAAVCLIVVVAAVALAAPSSDDPVLALDAASDARVVLPDGSVVDAEAGLELPDGTTITAGDDAVVIDGTTVAPGQTVVIRDGEVRFEASPDDPVAAPPERPVGDRPTTDPTTTTTSRPGDRPPDRTSPPTIVTAPPVAPTTPATTPRPADSTTTTTSRPADPSPLSLTARRVDDRRISLTWTAYRGGDFDRVVVVRTVSTGTGPPPRPVAPTDGAVVLTSGDPQTLGARDTPAPGVTASAYRVFVLDASGVVVGISNIAPG